MAVCDFNMKFTFAYAGWEGSAHDSRVFSAALRDTEINFPKPSEGMTFFYLFFIALSCIQFKLNHYIQLDMSQESIIWLTLVILICLDILVRIKVKHTIWSIFVQEELNLLQAKKSSIVHILL